MSFERLFSERAGSVLMEYVIVCCFIGVIVVELFHKEFFNFDDGFVGLGLVVKTAIQRVLGGIALPIP
jgi:hypothetical protein